MRVATAAALAAIALSIAATPATPTARGPDGRRLPLETDTFTAYLVRGSDTTRVGFAIDQLEAQGGRLIRVYRSEDQVVGKLLDTIVDQRADIRPVSIVQHSTFERAAVAFGPTGLTGWHRMIGSDSTPVANAPSADVYDGASLDLFVRASALAAGVELSVRVYRVDADTTADVHATVSGPTTVGGRACWVVRARFLDTPVTFWVDTATRALRRQVIERRQGDAVMLAAEPVDAHLVPDLDSDAWTRGMALFNQNRLQPAALLLFYGSLESPADGRRLDWAAETLRRLGGLSGAVLLARRASRLGTCDAFAEAVIGTAYNPQSSTWDSVSYDSTWVHLKRAVGCDPGDGNGWIVLWGEALRRDDTALAQDAVRHLYNTGFLAPGLLELARWTLQSAPPRAVLLARGDLDTYGPLAVQLMETLRPDIAVVNQPMLQLPWYTLRVNRETGLPLPVGADSLRAAALKGEVPEGLGDSVVALWRRRAADGTLGRVLLFPITNPPNPSESAPGKLRLVGPARRVDPDPNAPDVDTAVTRVTLGSLNAARWAGPLVSAQDRSPLRRSTAVPPAVYPVFVTALYAQALWHAGQKDVARQVVNRGQAFGVAAGLDSAYVAAAFTAVDSAIGPRR